MELDTFAVVFLIKIIDISTGFDITSKTSNLQLKIHQVQRERGLIHL